MHLFNTSTGKIELFTPQKSPVGLYTCGPTVYDKTHIGHIRTYIGSDVLKRTLIANGFAVRHVMNITDVGHLTDDADAGEDKLEKGAAKTGKTVWEVAEYYTNYFFRTMDIVGVSRPDIICKATEHIPAMIALVETLVAKGLTYESDEAVYFDVSKYPAYGALSKQNLTEKKQAARTDVYTDPNKKNPADFVLWFKRVGKFKDHTMHWDSPWGDGFPGWHVECSAMSMQYLGESLDIHTGGVDHIPVHHENEIAQSTGATGKPFVHYWVHYNHLFVDGRKMSKSLNNFYTIDDVLERSIHPMAIRLLFLQTHYRQETNFTWDAAQAAHTAYLKLKDRMFELSQEQSRSSLSAEKLQSVESFASSFAHALANDVQTPQALGILWETLKSNIPSPDKYDLLRTFTDQLGLVFDESADEKTIVPDEITELAQKRMQAKKEKNYEQSDKLRDAIREKGYEIEDREDGYVLKKRT